MKRAGLQCDSCRRPGAEMRLIEGHQVPACDECMASDFRKERMANRAREATR